jgi:hypothetical protein
MLWHQAWKCTWVTWVLSKGGLWLSGSSVRPAVYIPNSFQVILIQVIHRLQLG